MNNDVEYIQLSSLLPIQLEKAYDILYAGILTDEEITRRPFNIKVERVKQVLAGDVTPGCSASRWYEFFRYLTDATRMQPPEPKANPGGILSPAEWLAALGDTQPETRPVESFTEGLLREYADHVARRVARNVRHRACEIVVEESGGCGSGSGKHFANAHNAIMNIQIRDVYPAGKEKETS